MNNFIYDESVSALCYWRTFIDTRGLFFLIFFNSFNSLSYLFNFKVAGMVPYELLWHLEDEHKDDVECQYWLEEYYGTPSSWYVIFNFGNLQNGSLG
jgi:hypothetical protein